MAKHYISSKLIDWVEYDEGAMQVFGKNKLVIYYGVSEEIYKELISQKKPDTFYRNVIKKNFEGQDLS